MTLNAKLTYKAGIGDVVTVDTAAFLAEAQKYFNLSEFTKEWQTIKVLSWPSSVLPPNTWATFETLKELFQFVCASVEIAKQKVLDEFDPDRSKGTKFDREVALGTAVAMVAALVKFQSPKWFPGLSLIINKMWMPMIHLLIQFYFSGQTITWATASVQILGIII